MSLISLSTIATMYCPSTITSTCMHKNCKIVLVQQLAVSFFAPSIFSGLVEVVSFCVYFYNHQKMTRVLY